MTRPLRSNPAAPTYDSIWRGYDGVRRADPWILSRIQAYLGPARRGMFLDAGCGTGNYTAELASAGGVWHGVDHSARMLAEAAQKSDSIHWRLSDLLSLPYDVATFDGIVSTLVLHHLESLVGGFTSMARVLKPGGRIVIFTSTREQMLGYWLNHYFPEAMRRSVEQMPCLAEIEAAAAAAGLREVTREPYSVRPDLVDSFLYSGKNAPWLYLDDVFRQGSSTFRSLADPAEVSLGCERLAQDLSSNAFMAIRDRYPGKRGDYLFLVYTRELCNTIETGRLSEAMNTTFTECPKTLSDRFLHLLRAPRQELVEAAIRILDKPYGRNHWIDVEKNHGITFAIFGPKSRTSFHHHQFRRELFAVRAGQIGVLGKSPSLLHPGGWALSFPGVDHALVNEGDDEAEVLELVSPWLPTDKVRLEDPYGRRLGSVGVEE
jgi:SAM-dependent methyltransferase